MFVIHDGTQERDLQPPPGLSLGLDLSSRPTGLAYGGTAEPFPDSLVIPRSEWQARIAERKERKTQTRDLCDAAGLTVLNQERTNYCWVNAPTHCVEIIRVVQNQPLVRLSPASVGGPITGYKNVGGWGKPALQYIVDNGLVPQSMWPANAIQSRYDTAESRAIRQDYRVTEWWELEPLNLDHLISCLLLGLPVALGYNWWAHEVTGVDPDWIDGAIALVFDNSWDVSWGTNGRGTIQGSRMLPDDAVVPRVAVAA